MNPESILEQLQPLREPDPVSWWPPAPGWWLLAALLLAALVYGAVLLWRYYRRGAALRAARVALAAIEQSPAEPAERAAALGALQRRVAIRIAGRQACAGLTGAHWADFLNSLARDEHQYFDATLTEIYYRREVDSEDCNDALQATQRWLQKLERPR